MTPTDHEGERMWTYVAAKDLKIGDTVVGRGDVLSVETKGRKVEIAFAGFPARGVDPSTATFSPTLALERVDRRPAENRRRRNP
jgi:hypothetical protein